MNKNNHPTIVDLRRSGYKVRVSHFRNVINQNGQSEFARVTKINKKNREFKDFLALGGETQIDITNKYGITFSAIAKCSKKDPFNRRLGNLICLNRLAAQNAF